VIGVSNRSRYLTSRLIRSAREIEVDGIEIELLAGQLMAEAIAPHSQKPYSRTQIDWYTSRIDAVRWKMENDLTSALTLRALARAAGMSPYHFAHIFSELVGMPPHRYLMTARLCRAARYLLDGANATEACYAVGFNHPSHFSRMFHREFGCSPSRFRETRSTKARKLQDGRSGSHFVRSTFSV